MAYNYLVFREIIFLNFIWVFTWSLFIELIVFVVKLYIVPQVNLYLGAKLTTFLGKFNSTIQILDFFIVFQLIINKS